MSINALSPAPWAEYGEGGVVEVNDGNGDLVAESMYRPDAKFICLARKAIEVAMRRKWFSYYSGSRGGWLVSDELEIYADPFTALVETDRLFPEAASTGEGPMVERRVWGLRSWDEIASDPQSEADCSPLYKEE